MGTKSNSQIDYSAYLSQTPSKLSNAHKAELSAYFRGDVRYETNKQDQEVLRQLYAEMLFYLVDDNGQLRKPRTEYLRDGSLWHCGKPYKNLEGKKYCEVCGVLQK